MMTKIHGWTFNTEDIRSIRYRYSLGRLILDFGKRIVEIEMPQEEGKRHLQQIQLSWQTDKEC